MKVYFGNKESKKYPGYFHLQFYYDSGLGFGFHDYLARDYAEFVIDVLNHDYYHLLGLSNKDTVDQIQITARGLSNDFTGAKLLYEDLSLDVDDRYKILKEELNQFFLPWYSQIAELVFAGSSDEDMTSMQRYFCAANVLIKDFYEITQSDYSDIESGSEDVSYINKHEEDFITEEPSSNINDLPYELLTPTCNATLFSLEILTQGHGLPFQYGNDKSIEELYSTECKAFSDFGSNIILDYKLSFSSIYDAFIFFFFKLLESNRPIRKCLNCQTYFLPERSTARYCCRPSPEDNLKTCREYVKYKNTLTSSKVTANLLYKQIYNNLRNKAMRSNDAKRKEKCDRFVAEADKYRNAVKIGQIDEAVYVEWLQKYKETNRERGVNYAKKIDS